MKFNRLILVSALVLSAVVARAQGSKEPQWFQASTEHFLLFTDTTEVKAQRLLTDLEARYTAFSDAFGKLRPRPFPIEVFLFKSREDFVFTAPTRPPVNGVVPPEKNAYLIKGPDRLFVIAKDKSPEDIVEDVGHALGHAWFDHEVMWRPFWLAEGAAEYVRKLGRNADTKTVSEKDGFTVDDLLTIVPSATYQDTDPPTAFRLQSYRLLRVVLQENPQALREFVNALTREDGNEAKLGVPVDELTKKFGSYTETAAKVPAVAAAVKSQPAEAAYLAIHRGDLLVAADRTSDAVRYYNGETPAARGARAIMARFTRMPAEAMQQLARASRDLPDHGLVQYHFGAMESDAAKDREPQTAALESAIKLLPTFGRAYAELARLYVLSGKDKDALPLLDRALELEPEFADHYYDIRANALVGLGRSEEAVKAISIAEALPHVDRKATEAYMLKVAAVKKKIETKRREADSVFETKIRQDLERKANELEPVVPPKPPAPIPGGQINFEIASTSTIEVVDTVYPDYPEDIRKLGKAGKISLRVTVGPDGKVRNAVVSNSQLPQLNSATVDAAMKWTFKVPPRPRPAPVNITLTFTYTLQ